MSFYSITRDMCLVGKSERYHERQGMLMVRHQGSLAGVTP